MHAGSVVLLLNPSTGHVSPQFHVLFDENFTTIGHMQDARTPPSREEMYKNSAKVAADEAFNLAETWFNDLTNASNDILTSAKSISKTSIGS